MLAGDGSIWRRTGYQTWRVLRPDNEARHSEPPRPYKKLVVECEVSP